MSRLHFDEVAELINKSKNTQINTTPIRHEKDKWMLYSGTNKIPPFEYDFYVLYILASASKESIENAVFEIDNPEKTQVVFAQSLDSKFTSDIKSIVGTKIKNVFSTKEYLYLFIKDSLQNYSDRFAAPPKYYTVPKIQVPFGVAKKYPSPLQNFIELDSNKGKLGILYAEPGQGKTYTTQYLAHTIHKKNIIPILVNSHQWATMPVAELSSLWKTIINSFKFYESPINWIEGYEEEFINVMLKAGLFAIIFDGFDEYVLWNNGAVDPLEAINSILRLAVSCETSVILTTRTSFWNSTINTERSTGLHEEIYNYELLPFDNNEARNYFENRFNKNNKQVSYALEIYGKLKSGAKYGFAGRGFVLDLIADLVERSNDYSQIYKIEKSAMQWLVKSLCEREEVRQKLPLNPSEQIKICKEIAELISSGDTVDTESLKLIISVTKSTLTDGQIDNLTSSSRSKGTLKDHPLIRRDSSDHWNFINEQVYFNLLAELIREKAKQSQDHIGNLFEKLFISGNLAKGILLDDLSNTIVNQIFSKKDEEKSKEEVVNLNNALIYYQNSINDEVAEYMKKFATKNLLLSVDHFCKKGSQRNERTNCLKSFFTDGPISNLVFSGTLANFDFSGCKISNCKFNRVVISNCLFDDTTSFIDCEFIGGNIHHSSGFGLSIFSNITADQDAKNLIDSQMILDGKKNYDADKLRYDMVELLSKFIDRGTLRIKPIIGRNLNTGLFDKSSKKQDIIKIYKKNIIEKHSISGINEEGFNVRNEAKDSVVHFFTNGVFIGPVAKSFDELVLKLKL
jgi:hypothetical protein